MTAFWIALGAATACGALVCAPLGFRRGWHPALLAAGTATTALLVSTSIVQAFGWHAFYGFLLVLFPSHALAFLGLAVRRRQARRLLLVVTFAALTGIAWIRFCGLGAPGPLAALRATAIASTAGSVAGLALERRQASGPRRDIIPPTPT